MIAVAGMWELGWNTPIKEMDLWEMVCREFGVAELHMTPVSGIAPPNSELELIEHRDLFKMRDSFDYQVVIVDEQGKQDLSTFSHPKDCVYVFGKTTCSSLQLLRPDDLSIRLTTPQNKALLWSHQCAAIVLYDRMAKSWRQP